LKKLLIQAGLKLNPGGVFFMNFKLGEYKQLIQQDEMGERVFYLYTPEVIELLLPKGVFSSTYDFYKLRSKKWFNVTLVKRQ
jgi:hypothetical protein